MKTTKIIALLLATVMMLTLFAACGSDGDKNDANDNETTTTTTTTNDEKDPDGDGIDKIEVLPPDDGFSFTYDFGASTELPALEYNASSVRTDQWILESNGCKITTTAVYCKDNGLVSNLILRVELPSSSPAYSPSLIDDMKSYVEAAKSLNDSKNIYTIMDDGGYVSSVFCVVNVNGLQEADRDARVELVEAVMDLTPDSSKKAFYYDDIKAQFESMGFKTVA